ncbi:MAG: glycine cleavage system protein GcvH [Clostridia bacterium]|nr:glycine cleavage system protein GcvH [Clostridia bacterium]
MAVLQDLKYTKEHVWVKFEANRARLGITDYAQETLGDVVFTELPPVGKLVAKGESIGIVESVKSVSDIYTPLSGRVIDVNGQLADSPELINQDPYGQGWLMDIEPFDAPQMDILLDAAEYEKFLAQIQVEQENQQNQTGP